MNENIHQKNITKYIYINVQNKTSTICIYNLILTWDINALFTDYIASFCFQLVKVIASEAK